jgi:hypothetical protein
MMNARHSPNLHLQILGESIPSIRHNMDRPRIAHAIRAMTKEP